MNEANTLADVIGHDPETVEQEIQRKGLTAPRVTFDDVRYAIVSETFTVLPSCRTMICELTLRNGFTVRGESSCVSRENFDVELGQRISRDDATRKVWQLEAYRLAEDLHRSDADQARATGEGMPERHENGDGR